MKRNNMSTNLKSYHQSYYNNGSSSMEDYVVNGFPWPPKSYTCSFCRKEFKSAQALGGHMNVHRRDRARLRQSSPTLHESSQSQGSNSMLNLNLNNSPNPNPNNNIFSNSSLLQPSSSSSYSLGTNIKPITCTLPLFVVDGILLNPTTLNTTKNLEKSKMEEYESFACEDHDECRMLKKGENILRMDLEIGLPRDYDSLDLELRLGTTNYSN